MFSAIYGLIPFLLQSAENLRLVLEKFDPPVRDADCPDDTTPTATPKITVASLPPLEESPNSTEYSKPLPQIAQTGNITARPTFVKPVLFYGECNSFFSKDFQMFQFSKRAALCSQSSV